eukprot:CAMPEP_0179418464 /NCGR_PEP_ID=MMETSP0799-20121207/8019_1 /TAXON_ID=46947 /ORGANISM="Geminigera cryophila, Strain CCMP2564" /LENGTH=100 /DNA_ID=CAMNT_0021191751 /DNA_START=170 /DNA_END=472 /DNA_ORIENTATION=+
MESSFFRFSQQPQASAGAQELFHTFGAAIAATIMKRRPAINVLRVHIRAVANERLDNRPVIESCCEMQRRPLILIDCIYISTQLQQSLNNLHPAAATSLM